MIAIIIRGHERNSLTNNYLRNFLNKLSNHFTIHLYIHTWLYNEASTSWRPLNKPNRIITPCYINDYFKGFQIKKLIIEEDKNLNLEQSIDGYLCAITLKLPWKKMWFGQKRIIDVFENHNYYDFIINIRMDYFDRIINTHLFDVNNVIDNLIKEIINNQDKFNLLNFFFDYDQKISQEVCNEIDNLYIGPFNLIKELIYNFHYNLDDILKSDIIKDFNGVNQERLVYLQGLKINNNKFFS